MNYEMPKVEDDYTRDFDKMETEKGYQSEPMFKGDRTRRAVDNRNWRKRYEDEVA